MKAFLFIAFFCSTATATTLGAFENLPIKAEWHADGRHMILLDGIAFKDSKGIRWIASKGSKVDGASIPKFAWSIIGGPFEGQYRDASVIHDVACVERIRKWEEVHHAFYEAMIVSGVSEKTAKIMYAAVYHFGPRWVYEERKPDPFPVKPSSPTAPPPTTGQRERLRIEAVGGGTETVFTEISIPEHRRLSEHDFAALKKKIEASPELSLDEIHQFSN